MLHLHGPWQLVKLCDCTAGLSKKVSQAAHLASHHAAEPSSTSTHAVSHESSWPG